MTYAQVTLQNNTGSGWDDWLGRIFGAAQTVLSNGQDKGASGPQNPPPAPAFSMGENQKDLVGLAVIAILLWALTK